MPKPAFIIEGHMEKKILQSICPGVPIRRIGCNGDDVSMTVMAKFIDTLFRLFNNRYYPIVIMFDRERRELSCDALKQELSNELKERGFEGQYVIGIPDRTIESWILADSDVLLGKYYAVANKPSYEGSFGKNEIKSILGDEYNYHETTLGVEMFLNCDPNTIYHKSASFRALVSAVAFECRWINTINIT